METSFLESLAPLDFSDLDDIQLGQAYQTTTFETGLRNDVFGHNFYLLAVAYEKAIKRDQWSEVQTVAQLYKGGLSLEASAKLCSIGFQMEGMTLILALLMMGYQKFETFVDDPEVCSSLVQIAQLAPQKISLHQALERNEVSHRKIQKLDQHLEKLAVKMLAFGVLPSLLYY